MMPTFANPAGYEIWMGRWSTLLAPLFAQFAAVPRGARVLDVGSGTGALAVALLAADNDLCVTGIEPAADYVAYTRERISDPRLTFQVGDALAIPFPDQSFDATLSLLILQELPDAARALAEMRRVTQPGGIVAASQWDFESGMPMLRLFWDAVLEVVPNEAARKGAADCLEVAYPDEAALCGLWRSTGLTGISTERQQVEMTFDSFRDHWQPFLSNVTPTSSFAATLPEAERSELERQLRRKTLGDAPDGPFTLTAHAWAIRGLAPAG